MASNLYGDILKTGARLFTPQRDQNILPETSNYSLVKPRKLPK